MTLKKGTSAPLEGEEKVISVLKSTYTGMTAGMCHELAMTVEHDHAPAVKNSGPKVASPQVPAFLQMPKPSTSSSK